MRLYNTKSKKVEEFIPWNKDEVTMYTCGPTVYHFAHIGNLRTYITEDILEKSLNYLGYNVKRAMNITDVGHLSSDSDTGVDKMVQSAKKEHKSVLDIAKFYTDKFFEDADLLNIRKPDIIDPATNVIDDFILIIEKLLKEDKAYEAGGNIYFDTSKLDNYYSLTNHKEENLISGVRDSVEEDINKKSQTDFVLWFTKSKFDDQELKWDSPFGEGYPGWHIECTGIAIKHLGEYLDIHCGAVDNIFPHHTNEIAQSEAYLGHKWCNYWIHGEHLNDETGKMSKSKGGILTVDTLRDKGYNPIVYRYLCLMSHYRNQLVFSYSSLDGAVLSYNKLKNKVINLKQDEIVDKDIYIKYDDKFKDFISDNLNTASVITLIHDVLKSSINDSTKYALIKEWDTVLSLDLTLNNVDINEDYILDMINKRNEAKKNKDFALADSIRKELLEKKVVLKDTREGTIYEIEV